MSSSPSDFVLEQGTLLCTLHHKTNANRKMPVYVAFDDHIAAPLLTDDAQWAVPCDIVGLNSKKAKQCKVRFNSSVVAATTALQGANGQLVADRNSLKAAAIRDAMQYLDTLLMDSEWTRTAKTETVQRVHKTTCGLTNFLLQQAVRLHLAAGSMDLIWPLFSEDGMMKPSIQAAKAFLRNKNLATCIDVNVESSESGQEVRIVVNGKDLVRPLMRLSLSEEFLQNGKQETQNVWKMNGDYLMISLAKANPSQDRLPSDAPASISLYIHEEKEEREKMFDSNQLRVEELRRRLDASLASFQKTASQRDLKARALHVVRQNDAETMVEIGQPGARPVLDRLLYSSSPLAVICDVNGCADLAASPSDSIDSGLSLSPLTSPVSKHAPFYQYSEENRLGMRQRSASESGTPGLKGILKKTPQRINRFIRSVSESHHHDDFSLMRSATLECDESDENSENKQDDSTSSEGRPGRVKRVSFCEKISERRFKPKQCIATQARKNEKKRQAKQRKEERQRSLSVGDSDGIDAGIEDLVTDKSSDEIEAVGCGSRCSLDDRTDSGFGEDEENITEGPEEAWKAMVRMQRAQ